MCTIYVYININTKTVRTNEEYTGIAYILKA